MKKCMLIILIGLLIIPIVLSTTVQYSTDNSTWENVTNVNETSKEAYQINLQANTLYYFRAKNSSTDWGYVSQRTKSGGINEMEIAIILALIGISAILIYLTATLKEEKYLPIKMLFLFVVLFLILISLNIASSMSSSESYNPNINMAYQICLWSFVFVLGYFIIIFIRETVLSSREKQKKKIRGEE